MFVLDKHEYYVFSVWSPYLAELSLFHIEINIFFVMFVVLLG